MYCPYKPTGTTIMRTIKNLTPAAITNIVLAVLFAPVIIWGIARIIAKVLTSNLGVL